MPPFYLTGPTASGKSALAVRLAQLCHAEIVNADAFQLYAGLEILTASPSPEERSAVPHHLFGILPLDQSCNAGRFASLAQPVLADIVERGKLAIVVGGSGLYLKALTHGLEDSPPCPPDLRAELSALDPGELLARLQAADPASAASIEPRNRRYLQRALEITLTTGRPASDQRRAWLRDAPDLRGLCLDIPRTQLLERISLRTRSMLQRGAIDEVAAVTSWSDTSRKAIGVREIEALLRGEASLETTREAIDIATRRYAKRQTTWFKREAWLTPVSCHPGPASPEDLADRFHLRP